MYFNNFIFQCPRYSIPEGWNIKKKIKHACKSDDADCAECADSKIGNVSAIKGRPHWTAGRTDKRWNRKAVYQESVVTSVERLPISLCVCTIQYVIFKQEFALGHRVPVMLPCLGLIVCNNHSVLFLVLFFTVCAFVTFINKYCVTVRPTVLGYYTPDLR